MKSWFNGRWRPRGRYKTARRNKPYAVFCLANGCKTLRKTAGIREPGPNCCSACRVDKTKSAVELEARKPITKTVGVIKATRDCELSFPIDEAIATGRPDRSQSSYEMTWARFFNSMAAWSIGLEPGCYFEDAGWFDVSPKIAQADCCQTSEETLGISKNRRYNLDPTAIHVAVSLALSLSRSKDGKSFFEGPQEAIFGFNANWPEASMMPHLPFTEMLATPLWKWHQLCVVGCITNSPLALMTPKPLNSDRRQAFVKPSSLIENGINDGVPFAVDVADFEASFALSLAHENRETLRISFCGTHRTTGSVRSSGIHLATNTTTLRPFTA